MPRSSTPSRSRSKRRTRPRYVPNQYTRDTSSFFGRPTRPSQDGSRSRSLLVGDPVMYTKAQLTSYCTSQTCPDCFNSPAVLVKGSRGDRYVRACRVHRSGNDFNGCKLGLMHNDRLMEVPWKEIPRALRRLADYQKGTLIDIQRPQCPRRPVSRQTSGGSTQIAEAKRKLAELKKKHDDLRRKSTTLVLPSKSTIAAAQQAAAQKAAAQKAAMAQQVEAQPTAAQQAAAMQLSQTPEVQPIAAAASEGKSVEQIQSMAESFDGDETETDEEMKQMAQKKKKKRKKHPQVCAFVTKKDGKGNCKQVRKDRVDAMDNAYLGREGKRYCYLKEGKTGARCILEQGWKGGKNVLADIALGGEFIREATAVAAMISTTISATPAEANATITAAATKAKEIVTATTAKTVKKKKKAPAPMTFRKAARILGRDSERELKEKLNNLLKRDSWLKTYIYNDDDDTILSIGDFTTKIGKLKLSPTVIKIDKQDYSIEYLKGKITRTRNKKEKYLLAKQAKEKKLNERLQQIKTILDSGTYDSVLYDVGGKMTMTMNTFNQEVMMSKIRRKDIDSLFTDAHTQLLDEAEYNNQKIRTYIHTTMKSRLTTARKNQDTARKEANQAVKEAAAAAAKEKKAAAERAKEETIASAYGTLSSRMDAKFKTIGSLANAKTLMDWSPWKTITLGSEMDATAIARGVRKRHITNLQQQNQAATGEKRAKNLNAILGGELEEGNYLRCTYKNKKCQSTSASAPDKLQYWMCRINSNDKCVMTDLLKAMTLEIETEMKSNEEFDVRQYLVDKLQGKDDIRRGVFIDELVKAYSTSEDKDDKNQQMIEDIAEALEFYSPSQDVGDLADEYIGLPTDNDYNATTKLVKEHKDAINKLLEIKNSKFRVR